MVFLFHYRFRRPLILSNSPESYACCSCARRYWISLKIFRRRCRSGSSSLQELLTLSSGDRVHERDEASGIVTGFPRVLHSQLICFRLKSFSGAIRCASKQTSNSFRTIIDSVIRPGIDGSASKDTVAICVTGTNDLEIQDAFDTRVAWRAAIRAISRERTPASSDSLRAARITPDVT